MSDVKHVKRSSGRGARIVAGIVCPILIAAAIAVADWGFADILRFRILERIPPTSIGNAPGAETHIRAHARKFGNLLSGPHTGVPCVYFRYLEEEERRDSDGDTRWVTITDNTQSVDFLLVDDSGELLIPGQEGEREWKIARSFRTTVKDRRYTEWRIDIDAPVTVFGYLDPEVEPLRLSFATPGDYLPIISTFPAAQIRGDMGYAAVLKLAGAVAALVFACFALIYALRWHRTLRFLMLITVSVTALLGYLGWRSLESEVTSGAQRVDRQRAQIESRIRKYLVGRGVADSPAGLTAVFRGLGEHADWQAAAPDRLSESDRQRLDSWLHMAYEVRARYLQQIAGFPENWFAEGRGLASPAAVALTPEQLAAARANLERFQETRSESSGWLTGLALLLVPIAAWFGIREIKLKRMIENLPTSKTAGVAYGLTEVAGRLTPDEDITPLRGPLSARDCVWYHYQVEEKRGSGKNARWVTIQDDTRKQPFFCEDMEGRIRVFPAKADIITYQKSRRSEGRRRYKEARLEPGDELYLLGKASIDRSRGDELVLRRDEELPFIIANYSESEVMVMKAGGGIFLLCLGVSLLFLASLWISSGSGGFSSLDFVLLSLVGPLFLVAVVIMLMYNDLVFLRNRFRRDWSNIQVSLKKRANLLDSLQKVVQTYMAHETELQQLLVQLRKRVQDGVTDPQDLDEFSSSEHALIDLITVRGEAYPELKAGGQIADFSRRLIRLENEVALMRAGFNDAVTLYNTRIRMFPDLILAKLFAFRAGDLLSVSVEAHELPVVKLQPADR